LAWFARTLQGILPRVTRLLSLALLALAAGALAADLDPSADGPFAVGVRTVTFVDAARSRTLVTEVWYPADAAGRDATPRHGRWRLVLVAHGNCGFRTNYEYLTIPLASRGFLVAAPDFPGINQTDCDNHVPPGDIFRDPPADLVFLRAAFHDRSGPAGVLASAVRGQHAGLVGHSLGGAAVVNAAVADPDMRAVVTLAPVAATPQGQAFVSLRPRRPVLVVAGTADTTLPPQFFAEPFFAALPPPAFFVSIVGGTHDGLTDMDASLSPAALAREEMLARRYTVAFLERYVGRRRRQGRFLTPEDAASEGPDVQLTARPS
jgi:predicted dienelactone hydrolase